MKEPLMKAFSSQIIACDFTEKELRHFLTTLKVFQNSYSRYSVEHWWTAVPKVGYKNEKGHA